MIYIKFEKKQVIGGKSMGPIALRPDGSRKTKNKVNC